MDQKLLPVDRDRVRCGADSCASNNGPKNAVGHSTWSKDNGNSESIFDFTYKGDCYRTETRAFCGKGKVVRFVVPSKGPTCVLRTEEGSGKTDYSGSSDVKLACPDGYREDRARNLCVRVTQVDFS